MTSAARPSFPPPPTIGRIVHYSAGPSQNPPCQAAIVVAAHPTGVDPARLSPADRELVPGPLLTLCVFTVNGPQMRDAELDERTCAAGTWHWPDRTPKGTST